MLLIFVAVLFCGCSKYSSSYSATVLITSEDKNSGSVSFSTFKGTKVLKLNSCADEQVLKCHGSLGEGSVKVYYDYDDTKQEMFELTSGGEFEQNLEIPTNSTVYIIIESENKSEDGEFKFEICTEEEE